MCNGWLVHGEEDQHDGATTPQEEEETKRMLGPILEKEDQSNK